MQIHNTIKTCMKNFYNIWKKKDQLNILLEEIYSYNWSDTSSQKFNNLCEKIKTFMFEEQKTINSMLVLLFCFPSETPPNLANELHIIIVNGSLNPQQTNKFCIWVLCFASQLLRCIYLYDLNENGLFQDAKDSELPSSENVDIEQEALNFRSFVNNLSIVVNDSSNVSVNDKVVGSFVNKILCENKDVYMGILEAIKNLYTAYYSTTYDYVENCKSALVGFMNAVGYNISTDITVQDLLSQSHKVPETPFYVCHSIVEAKLTKVTMATNRQGGGKHMEFVVYNNKQYIVRCLKRTGTKYITVRGTRYVIVHPNIFKHQKLTKQ